ncbi:MAG TPA: hypothetical protein VN972_05680, partial [Methylomirabilota bacterium]|nr:hypothetical protein [Methylomirabilota bacterium]
MRHGCSPLIMLAAAGGLFLAASSVSPARAELLVPMDETQTDHLRAYGLTYWTLQQGYHDEWLLNYRGGSFLLPDDARIASEASVRGVRTEQVGGAQLSQIRAEIADNNMES